MNKTQVDAVMNLLRQRTPGFVSFEKAGTRYESEEYQYKLAASRQAQGLLEPYVQNKKRLKNGEEAQELGENLIDLTNFFNWRDKEALEKGVLGKSEAWLVFMGHVLDCLRGLSDDQWRGALETLLRWLKKQQCPANLSKMLPTYFLFLYDPARHMFIKPSMFDQFLRRLGEEPTGHGEHLTVAKYANVLDVCRRLREALADLRIRDNIDIHSVAWLTRDGVDDDPSAGQAESAGTEVVAPEEQAAHPEMHVALAPPPLNLILYGPPGTGKTYHTMNRAVTICDGEAPAERRALSLRFNELRDQGRIEFVTFHQSFGYEEFVEGIRPVIADGDVEDAEDVGGDVRYVIRPGVFKRICDGAKAGMALPQHVFNLDLSKHRVWKMSLGDTQKTEEADVYQECIDSKQIRLGYGMRQDYKGCNDRAAILAKLRKIKPDAADNDYNAVSVDWFKNVMKVGDLVIVSKGNRKFRAIGRVTGEYLHTDADDYDQVRAIEWLLHLEESLSSETILRKAFSQMTLYQLRENILRLDALGQILSGKAAKSPLPFVLIIDEINRGNISKVFGELITLIEPDKRLGAENELRATLPYSGDRFGVPPNLHLIGTMNTADRSIAFLDTALRRRFRFQEMMPDAQVIRDHVGKNGVVEGIDVAALLDAINRRVELLYDRDHQVGHSYFLGVRTLADLREVFQYQVIPLLQEYFHDDWTKVCHVLACPYDCETGKALSTNPLPLIVALTLDGALTPGTEPTDVEPRFRYAANPELDAPQAGALHSCFVAMLNGSEAGNSEDADEED